MIVNTRLSISFFFILFSLNGLRAQVSDKIQISANTLEYDQKASGKVLKFYGDVRFRQGNTLMYSDSAYQYEEINTVEAFGNVHINHQDSIHIYGEQLTYDGNNKTAKLERKVRMVERSMTLTCDKLDFDMKSNTGYYTTGGKIVNGNNTLTSIYGYYYSSRKDAFFKKDVVLLNPDYTIYSDTLQYNTSNKITYFFGPTVIISDTDKMYCERGMYHTEKQVAQFSQNALLMSKSNIMAADSIYYERMTEFGKAFNNIELYDTINKITVYGDYAELLGKKRQSIITKNAAAKQYMDKDSMFLLADTIYSYQKTPYQKELVKAYRHVKLFKSDIQAICDSMVYNREDSAVTLYSQPAMWSGVNQITSDTIILFINNNQLDSFNLVNNAFMISREAAKHFNQVKGKNMYGEFEDNKIRYMRVYGNGQSIYYVKEDSAYMGVNVIDCSEMEFYFIKNKIEKCNFITNPDAIFYPLDELKPEELRLKNFNWMSGKRPVFTIIPKRYRTKSSFLQKTSYSALISKFIF